VLFRSIGFDVVRKVPADAAERIRVERGREIVS